MKKLFLLFVLLLAMASFGNTGDVFTGKVREVYLQKDPWTTNSYRILVMFVDANNNPIVNDVNSVWFIFRQDEISWIRDVYATLLTATASDKKVTLTKGDSSMNPYQKLTTVGLLNW